MPCRLSLLLLCAACSDNKKPAATGGGDAPPEVAEGCNPLVADDCLTPFPSAVHEIADTSTKTGYRVHLTPSTMPVQNDGIALDPARMNARDGFSPSLPFIVYFKAGVDATQLPTAAQKSSNTSV